MATSTAKQTKSGRLLLSPQEPLVAGGPAEEFERRIQEVFKSGQEHLVIDLRGVPTIDSAGIRALQRVYKLYTPEEERSRMTRVKLCNAPPQIYHVLRITGFLLTILNYESMQAAIDAFTE